MKAPDKKITYEEFAKAMEEKQRLEKYLEHLTRITRAYMYDYDSERVVGRKFKSNEDKY